MSLKIDFHIHTWYSDGTMSPEEIVEKYAGEEFSTIAITDHEVTDGIREAQEAAKGKGIKVVPGIELATDMDGRELHILGYYIDEENPALQDALARLAVIRKKRNAGILKALQQQNIDIKEEDLIQRPGQTYIGKPNFARALAAKGYMDEASQAFTPGQFWSPMKSGLLKRKAFNCRGYKIDQRCRRDSRSRPPMQDKGIGQRESEEFRRNFGDAAGRVKKAGLKGLECIYPTHSDEERVYFISMAYKYHLHVTEGSDFHGR
ncbi:MAG: PHP domain-containing protein [Anaerovoracaceae bacterium]